MAKVGDLVADPHLNASGALLDVVLPGKRRARLPRLPIEMGGRKPGLRNDAPTIGEHTRDPCCAAITESEIAELARDNVIVVNKGDASC